MKRMLMNQAIAMILGLLGALYVVGTAGYARTMPATALGLAIVCGPMLIGWLSGFLTVRSHEDRWWMILAQIVAALVYLVTLMPAAAGVLAPAAPVLRDDYGVGVLMVTTFLSTVGSVFLGTVFGSVTGHSRTRASTPAVTQH